MGSLNCESHFHFSSNVNFYAGLLMYPCGQTSPKPVLGANQWRALYMQMWHYRIGHGLIPWILIYNEFWFWYLTEQFVCQYLTKALPDIKVTKKKNWINLRTVLRTSDKYAYKSHKCLAPVDAQSPTDGFPTLSKNLETTVKEGINSMNA